MNLVLEVAWLISTGILFLILIRALVRTKYRFVVNPSLVFSTIFSFYFNIPLFFINEINLLYNWDISAQQETYTYVIILMVNFMLSLICYTRQPYINLNQIEQPEIKNNFYASLWFIITFYLILVVCWKWQSGQLFFNQEYIGSVDPFKLKNISYFLLFLTPVAYAMFRKNWVFLPNVIIVVLDLISGSRTTAFIALIPVYITVVMYRRKLFIVPILVILSLLILIGIFRSNPDIGTQNVPMYIKALGEFRETFIPLPVFILDDNFIGRGSVFSFLNSFGSPILQPLRVQLNEAFVRPGAIISEMVGRGYGLGSNFIIDALYYGYFGILLVYVYIIMISLSERVYFLLNTTQSIILASYFIVFLRLGIREGIISAFSTALFVFLVYCIPFTLINRLLVNATSTK